MSGPPKADREAELEGADVVPVTSWDEEHVPRLQEALLVRDFSKQRVAVIVWTFHIHLGMSRPVGSPLAKMT